jgi:hypothetical protein
VALLCGGSIWLAGKMVGMPIGIELSPEFFVLLVFLSSPLWPLVAFVVIVALRRKVSLRLLLTLMTAEAISLAAVGAAFRLARSIQQ